MIRLIIFLIPSLFNIICSNPIPIDNFKSVDCNNRETEFIYEFKAPNISGIDFGYFLFRFSVDNYINLIVKDENDTETELSLHNFDAIWYKITNLESQNYTFIVKSDISREVKMRFFDNTKEMNINLGNFNAFASLKFSSIEFDDPPMPFIFNLEEFPVSIIVYTGFSDTNYKINGDYLMNYCIIDKDDCIYKEMNNYFILEKDKKYKIKVNSYIHKSENEYIFKFEFSNYFLKEVEFGNTEFKTNSNINYYFFIVNIKDQEELLFYINHNYQDIHYKLISEKEKDNCIKEFTNNMNSGSSKTFISVNNKNNKDYLIIRIKYYSTSYSGYVFIISYLDVIYNEKEFEKEKGKLGIVRIKNTNKDKYIIGSSNKCMATLSGHYIDSSFENMFFFEEEEKSFLVDTRQEKAKIICYIYEKKEEDENKKYELNIYKNLDNIVPYYSSDFRFSRKISHTFDYLNYIYYLCGVEEEYYLYIKKYFGSDLYQYKELSAVTNISQFKIKPPNQYEYKVINNDLINITGFQLFQFFNYYGSLYDLYLQKVNDSQKIRSIFQYDNLIKLLNKNKIYYLDFTVDHLIKLDKNFLNATVSFKDEKGQTYLLNKENRIIKNLKGNKITVISTENALIYFYKKIENDSTIFSMEFDKSQKGKIMKFNITSIKGEYKEINILKDFSFKGYYPMIEEKSSDLYYFENGTATIYIDNWYDKLENDLDDNEEEKFIIYILDFNSNNFIISEPIYLDNLLSQKNTYNFEVIPPNKDGSLILSSRYNKHLEYQFMICKSQEIQFKIENSLNYFGYGIQEKYPYTKIINTTEEQFYLDLNSLYESHLTLFHSFKADNKFLFYYSFDNYYLCNSNRDSSIVSINYKEENILHILLDKGFYKCPSIYNIIIAKRNPFNNFNAFSNPCHLSKLFLEKNDSIIIKTKDDYGFENSEVYLDFDISPFKKNEEVIIGIINYNIYRSNGLNFYSPIEYTIGDNPVYEFKLGEMVEYNYKTKNFFKLEYNHQSDRPKNISFYFFDDSYFNFVVMDDENNKEIIIRDSLVNITLTKTGTYYFQIYDIDNNNDFKGKFMAFIPGGYIDTIDLSKKRYYQEETIEFRYYFEPIMYKVENITEDKLFYFSYKKNMKMIKILL